MKENVKGVDYGFIYGYPCEIAKLFIPWTCIQVLFILRGGGGGSG